MCKTIKGYAMEPYADLLQHDASTMPHGDPKMEEKVMVVMEKLQ